MSDKIKALKDLLTKLINNSSQVFIVGHEDPDFDCIGAALGISVFARDLGKNSYIVVGDGDQKIAPAIKEVIDDVKDNYNIISLDEFKMLSDKKSLLITVDVNKSYRISVKNDLGKVGKTLIIDHHQPDEFTIDTPYRYIDTEISSTSEVVTRLLTGKQLKEVPNSNIPTYLLAGIMLDSKRFSRNTSSQTYAAAEKLCRCGADSIVANRFVLCPNYDEDCNVKGTAFGWTYINVGEPTEAIVRNTQIKSYSQILGDPTVSYTINRQKPEMIYRQVELAKQADELLEHVTASFVFGYKDPITVGISARSTGKIDVGDILMRLAKEDFPISDDIAPELVQRNGGGNRESAGANITTSDIYSVEQKVMDLVQQLTTPQEEIDKIQQLTPPEEEMLLIQKLTTSEGEPEHSVELVPKVQKVKRRNERKKQ